MTTPPRLPADAAEHPLVEPELRGYTRWPGMLLMLSPFVISPLVALINQEVAYVVVPWACYRGVAGWVRVVPAVALIVLLALALVSFRDWRRVGGGTAADQATVADRVRFVALAGLGVTGISALAVSWQWIATWMVLPCLRS
jgi:hypothetical protein